MRQARKFRKEDAIFWILFAGAILSLILRRIFSPLFDDALVAFILGTILYLHGRVSRLEGQVALLPTSEGVRRIIREELGRRAED